MSDRRLPGAPSVPAKAAAIGFWSLVGACVVLGLLDFTYDKHGHYSWEELPGFHLLYGFAACAALIGVGWVVRRLVARDEDHYEP
jgi:hypothetical protein